MSVKQYPAFWVTMLCLAANPVMSQTFNEILSRPSDNSMTVSTLFSTIVQTRVDYGASPGVYTQSTPTVTSTANEPVVAVMTPLTPNTRYYYRTAYRIPGSGPFQFGPEHTFHTQRAPGAPFRFVVEADEHLYDKKGVRSLYKICLQNQAKDSADFMLSLGDTFGDDHTPLETTSADMKELHLDYRQYLGAVCHSMPFLFCLGNHEGEGGYWLDQTPPENIGVYGTLWRKYYYPNPVPDDFYSGNTTEEPYGIGLPENYYAFTWGDALFVILDVYRHCDVNEKPQKWDWTLGETQYNWLKTTLQTSTAKHKFVFAHHTRGQGRGGVATATAFEWGGIDGNQYKFDEFRPGWGQPIHQLMVANGVDIFFQGHDHLYAKEALDGLVYQEVPMPSDSTYQIGVLANADAYTDVTLDGSGHLRVSVSENCVTVDYVRAYLPADTLSGEHQNGEVAYSYSVGACASAVHETAEQEPFYAVFPNPATDFLTVQAKDMVAADLRLTLFNAQGQAIQTQIMPQGASNCRFDMHNLPPGLYALRWMDGTTLKTVKVVVDK